MEDVLFSGVYETFELSSRGRIFIVPAPFEMDRGSPEIRGRHVVIHDQRFLVTGVERYLPACPIRVGEMIGLLVKEAE